MAVPATAVYVGGIACTPDGAVYVEPTGSASITGGTSQWSDGAAATPSIAFASETGTGFWWSTSARINVSVTGALTHRFTPTTLDVASDTALVRFGASSDLNIGRQAAGRLAIMGATATPAGGSASLGLVFGSTSGFGIYIGSGVPTLSAAQGSLYLRSDGSSTSTRMYVNTNGTTGWTAVTTAT